MESDLKRLLVSCNAVLFGDFTLTSGKKSNYYINIKKATTDSVILSTIAKELAKFVDSDKIAGIELGSVPIAVAVALETKKKFLIVRKEPKGHGTNALIEGDFEKGERIIVIEDVTTTGNSALRAAKILRDAGAVVDTILTVVDREEGGVQNLEPEQLELKPLIRAKDLLKLREELNE